MTSAKKKPPIRLSELSEEYEEETRGQPGELSYVNSGGAVDSTGSDGRDWKGIVGGIIVSVFLAGILILFLTPSKASIKVLDENIREVNNRVEDVLKKVDEVPADLTKKVDAAITEARSAKEALSGYVRKGEVALPDLSEFAKKSDLPSPDQFAKKSDLDQLATSADINSLRSEIARLDKRLSALEVGSPSSSATETTRWRYDAYVEGSQGIAAVIQDVSPWRIEEEGIYEITLDIEWEAGYPTNEREYLSITLTPRDRDATVYVDEDSTWLETVRPSFREWDTYVATRRDGTARRITFEYPYDLDVGGPNAGSQRLYLEMELVYE